MRLEITKLGGFGDGFAEGPKGPLAIPFTAPGDVIEADLSRQGKRQTARLRQILESGPGRIDPTCPHFTRCGGCRMQHLNDPTYDVWKDGLWRQALTKAGIDSGAVEDLPIHRVATGTRRRARLAVQGTKVGFRIERSHQIEPIKTCEILQPKILEAAQTIAHAANQLKAQLSELTLTLLDDGIEAILHIKGSLDYPALQDFADLAGELDLARMSQSDERGQITPISHRRPGLMQFGGVDVEVPAATFLQATAEGQTILQGLVSTWLRRADHIADLFSGCGTFALPLVTERSERRLTAIDKDGPAIDALGRAAAGSGLVGRLDCQARDLFNDPLSPQELADYDAVVFDPPRAGAKHQSEMLAKSGLADIVAVSCNPSTFARDAVQLIRGGFQLRAIAPLDQFLWTSHLELAAHFQRV